MFHGTIGPEPGKEAAMTFYERIGLVCRSIPWGRVATYGQIALLCGKPQCPRQVG